MLKCLIILMACISMGFSQCVEIKKEEIVKEHIIIQSKQTIYLDPTIEFEHKCCLKFVYFKKSRSEVNFLK